MALRLCLIGLCCILNRWDIFYICIHYSTCPTSACLSCHRVRGGVHPGQVVSLFKHYELNISFCKISVAVIRIISITFPHFCLLSWLEQKNLCTTVKINLSQPQQEINNYPSHLSVWHSHSILLTVCACLIPCLSAEFPLYH